MLSLSLVLSRNEGVTKNASVLYTQLRLLRMASTPLGEYCGCFPLGNGGKAASVAALLSMNWKMACGAKQFA